MKTTPLRARWAGRITAVFLALAVFPCPAAAQAGTAHFGLNQLQQLNLEELMQTTVTSVSRQPEKLLDTASAIQVVSGDEIRRSGAPTMAEALRMADNLKVAQKDPHDWAISARGFNSNLGDKLLVVTSLELSVVGENLLHPSRAEFGPETAGREQVERTVFGKVACRF